MTNHFNKVLITTDDEEESFQSSNFCWICEKRIEIGDEKVKDDCHINGQFRGAAQQSRNINLQLTKKVHAVFHNLRGYDSHLSFYELKKFDVTIDVFMISKYLLTVCNL